LQSNVHNKWSMCCIWALYVVYEHCWCIVVVGILYMNISDVFYMVIINMGYDIHIGILKLSQSVFHMVIRHVTFCNLVFSQHYFGQFGKQDILVTGNQHVDTCFKSPAKSGSQADKQRQNTENKARSRRVDLIVI
jgi:hypothetical protein